MDSKEEVFFLLCEATGEKFPLRDEFTIGRGKNSHLQIDNNRVSREHGMICKEQNVFRYVDLRSANGSRVDGKRVEPNQFLELHHGSVIKVSNRQFTFCEKEDSDLQERTVITRGDRISSLSNSRLDSSGLKNQNEELPDKEKAEIQKDQQTNLKNHLNCIKQGDPELIKYLRSGIDLVLESPEQAVCQCRFIAQRALELIIRVEFPDQHIPDAWINKWKRSPVFFKDKRIWEGTIPNHAGPQLSLIRIMTGAKGVDPVARFIGKETYYLLDSIYSVSLPAGHPEAGYFQQSSFAISKMNDSVTLCELLAEELPK